MPYLFRKLPTRARGSSRVKLRRPKERRLLQLVLDSPTLPCVMLPWRSALTIALASAIAPAAARAQGSVTDQRGRTFTFPQPAQRVVTIAIPLFWHFMTVDGDDERIVGANAV